MEAIKWLLLVCCALGVSFEVDWKVQRKTWSRRIRFGIGGYTRRPRSADKKDD